MNKYLPHLLAHLYSAVKPVPTSRISIQCLNRLRCVLVLIVECFRNFYFIISLNHLFTNVYDHTIYSVKVKVTL